MEALASFVTIPKFLEPYSLFRKLTKQSGFLKINDWTIVVGFCALFSKAEENKASSNRFGFFSKMYLSLSNKRMQMSR